MTWASSVEYAKMEALKYEREKEIEALKRERDAMRAVVDAAREYIHGPTDPLQAACYDGLSGESKYRNEFNRKLKLREALAAYDKDNER